MVTDFEELVACVMKNCATGNTVLTIMLCWSGSGMLYGHGCDPGGFHSSMKR